MAAGSGLTAQTDLSLTKTLVGVSSGAYSPPANNWVALFTTQFTAAAKAGATEWLVSSDTTPYARQPQGAAGSGWTINAYTSGTGVFWTSNAQTTQPAVQGNAQTLYAVGWCDSVGPTGGNVNFFADLPTGSSQPVAIGQQVIIAVYSGPGTGASFTTF